MKYNCCVICGKINGEYIGDYPTVLKQLPMLRSYSLSPSSVNDERSVTICQFCHENLLVDTARIMHEVQSTSFEDNRSVSDVFLVSFIKQYLLEVVKGTRAPSITEIAGVLNACGIRSPRGELWTMQNLYQKFQRLGFNPREIMEQKREEASVKEKQMDEALGIAQKYEDRLMPVANPIPIKWDLGKRAEFTHEVKDVEKVTQEEVPEVIEDVDDAEEIEEAYNAEQIAIAEEEATPEEPEITLQQIIESVYPAIDEAIENDAIEKEAVKMFLSPIRKDIFK